MAADLDFGGEEDYDDNDLAEPDVDMADSLAGAMPDASVAGAMPKASFG